MKNLLKTSQWLNKKDAIIFVLLPAALQLGFPRLWLEPFLAGLFVLAWRGKTFVTFPFVFVWSIISAFATRTNPGIEILGFGLVWYLLNLFSFSSRIGRFITVIVGGAIFLSVKMFFSTFSWAWSAVVTLKFFAVFTLANLILCWLLFAMDRYRGFSEQWNSV
jgi:hypothetical protein